MHWDLLLLNSFVVDSDVAFPLLPLLLFPLLWLLLLWFGFAGDESGGGSILCDFSELGDWRAGERSPRSGLESEFVLCDVEDDFLDF